MTFEEVRSRIYTLNVKAYEVVFGVVAREGNNNRYAVTFQPKVPTYTLSRPNEYRDTPVADQSITLKNDSLTMLYWDAMAIVNLIEKNGTE